MKKIIYLLGISLLVCLTVVGQSKSKKVDIQMGPEEKASKRSTLNGIVGFDESGFYAIKSKYAVVGSSKVTLEKYNHKMNLVRSVELELEEQGKEKVLEKIVMLDGELYLFSSFFNKKTDKKYLFVQTINKKTLNFGKRSRKIAEYDVAGGFLSSGGSIGLTLSRDSSKVMVFSDIRNKRKERDEFAVKVFDNKMQEIWEKKAEMPYMNNEFSVKDWKVDNEGNAYMIGVVYDKKADKGIFGNRGNSIYRYKILSYKNDGAKSKTYDINAGDKFISDLQLAIDDNGDLICAGFYSDENTFNVKGSYFLKMDRESQAVKSKSFKEFSIESMLSESSEKQKAKAERRAKKGKNVELYNYDLDEIIIRDDGGAILVGEQFFIRTSTTTDSNGNRSTTYYYHYNDIIVVNISPEGEIGWVELVPKRQVSANDGGFFSSYVSMIANDKLYFVFNDHANNLTRREGDKVYYARGRKDVVIVLVEVDKNGKETREALFTMRDADIAARPKVSQQVSDNELIIFGQRKKTHRFVKLKF